MLLFSQWTMTLDLLEWYMQLKGFSYVRLDGNTQVRNAARAEHQNSRGRVECFCTCCMQGQRK